MTSQETLAAIFEFSSSAWRKEANLELIPQPHRWLLGHPSAWHATRFDEPLEGAQKIIIYNGEAGTGKTTQLDYDAARLDARDDTIVIRLDFSQATLASCPASDFDKKLWDVIAGQVDTVIERYGVEVPYRAALHALYMQTQGGAKIARLRARFGRNGETPYTDMNPSQLATCEPIRKALARSEKKSGPTLSLPAAQNIPGYRTVVCVDNMDHLGIDKVEKLFQHLNLAIEGDTLAYIAVRSEHYHLLKRFKHERPVVQRNFHVEEDLVFSIANARCQGAISYAQECVPEQLHEIRQYVRRMTDLVADIKEDNHSKTILNSWHNGDLRQMLSFLSQTSWSTYKRFSQASVRSLVYRSLVKEALPSAFHAGGGDTGG